MFNGLRKIYKDSILRNSIYLIMTNFSGLAVGFFFWMIVTKYYTPNDVGIVSAILSGVALISMISSIGLPMALTFYLPRYSGNNEKTVKIINSCMIMSMITSLIFSMIFVLGIGIWAPKLKPIIGNFEMIVIFIITTMMTTMSMLMGGIFTAGKRSSFQMIKENVFGIFRIFLIILLASFGMIGIFISWTIGLIVSITVGFFLLFKLWKYTPSLTVDPIVKDMANFSIGNYIAGIFYNLPKLLFPVMIVQLLSADSAGYFYIAMTIAGIFYGVSEAMAGPFLAESSDQEKFWNNVNKVIKFNIGLLIPGLILLAVFGKLALSIFNPVYAENSFGTLIILSVTSIPLSLVIVFNMIRNSQKKVVTVIKVDAMVTIITIILSIPLMKIWNIEGIAAAYLIANTIMAFIIIFRTENPVGFTLRLIRSGRRTDTKNMVI